MTQAFRYNGNVGGIVYTLVNFSKRSRVLKKLLAVTVAWFSLSVFFTNCSPGFKLSEEQGSLELLSTDGDLLLSFAPTNSDVMVSQNPVVEFSIFSANSTYVLKCYVNSILQQNCVSPISLAAQADGDHTVRVSAQNANGRILKEISHVYRVDRAAPVISIVSKPADQIGSSSAAVQFSVTDNLSASADIMVQCSLDSAAFATCASPVNYASLAAGAHSIKIKAIDKAGNASAETAINFNVILGIPTVTLTATPPAISNQTSASFSFSGGASYECSIDNGVTYAVCTSPKSYTGLVNGTYNFAVKSIDALGQKSGAATHRFTVDTVLPTSATVTSSVTSPTKESALNLTFVSTDASGIARYECSLDSATVFATCTSPKSYMGLTNGAHVFRVRAVDQAGNVSTISASTSGNSDTKIADEDQAFNVPANTTVKYGANGVFVQKTVSGAGTCSNTFFGQDPIAGVGKSCYTVAAVSNGGSGILSVTVDNEAPTLNITSTPANPSKVLTSNFAFTATDGISGIKLIECQLDSESTYSTCTSPKSYTAAKGNRTFAVRATDNAGNTVAKSYTWVVAQDATDGGGGGGSIGGPISSIDTGTDPAFANGGANLSINGQNITVTATRQVQTAAGVYKSDGTLIRTLWRREILNAGQSKSMTWDYKDDFGATVNDGSYQIKTIAHNVNYKWQGVVGNTSNRGADAVYNIQYGSMTLGTVGQKLHRSFHPISNMAISSNGSGFITTSYNEQQNGFGRFEINNPQVKTPLLHDDYTRIFELTTADANIAYFVNRGSYDNGNTSSIFYKPEKFIVGVKISDNSEYRFPNGTAWKEASDGNSWNSALDIMRDPNDRIDGIAVDPNGENLYVSHRNSGIAILNKTTGACRINLGNGSCGTNFSVPTPSQLAVDKNGNLWVIANNRKEVRKYTNPGTNPQLALTISGFGFANGIGVSPLTQTVVVVDSGADQQVKAYNSSNGNLVWTHGDRGGHSASGNPEVTYNKFFLTTRDSDFNYIAFEPSNTEEIFWVGDPGNSRNLKLKIPSGANGSNPLQYSNQIAYMPVSYGSAVDKANPRRVFNVWLEYEVDYSKKIYEGWKLVRNWDLNLDGQYKQSIVGGPRDVFTTPQGRTYALLIGNNNDIVELTSSGMRKTGVSFSRGTRLVEDMNVRYARVNNGRYQIMQRNFTGIDSNGNPQYSAEQMVASGAETASNGQKYAFYKDCAHDALEPLFPKTSSGVIVTFDPCKTNGYHLGGIKAGASDWSFSASPNGTYQLQDGMWIINGDGSFDTRAQYPASTAHAAGRHIIYNSFGEFWIEGQANQWIHFLDNGLFIGQFGVPCKPSPGKIEALEGSSGNAFANTMVEVDGNIYLYNNDESAHAGVHRWRLANLNSIQEAVGNIGKGVGVNNPGQIATMPIPK